MRIKDIAQGFAAIFPIVFVVSLVVSYLYGLLVHGEGMLEWGSSIRFAIIFGLVLPILQQIEKKK